MVILTGGILDLCHLLAQALPFVELHESEGKLTCLHLKTSWAAVLRHFISPSSCSSFPFYLYITGRIPRATSSSCFYPEAHPQVRGSLYSLAVKIYHQRISLQSFEPMTLFSG